MQTNRKWLKQGQQTKITTEIKKIANKLKASNEIDTIFNIIQWLNSNIKHNRNKKWRIEYLRARTTDQILKSRKSSGCGDKALIFSVLARANHIPAKIVEAIDRDWLSVKNPKDIYGHVFVDIYINKQWRIADPAMGILNTDYQWPMNKKFIVLKKGLDFWDIGIKNFDDLKKQFLKFREEYNKSKKPQHIDKLM